MQGGSVVIATAVSLLALLIFIAVAGTETLASVPFGVFLAIVPLGTLQFISLRLMSGRITSYNYLSARLDNSVKSDDTERRLIIMNFTIKLMATAALVGQFVMSILYVIALASTLKLILLAGLWIGLAAVLGGLLVGWFVLDPIKLLFYVIKRTLTSGDVGRYAYAHARH